MAARASNTMTPHVTAGSARSLADMTRVFVPTSCSDWGLCSLAAPGKPETSSIELSHSARCWEIQPA